MKENWIGIYSTANVNICYDHFIDKLVKAMSTTGVIINSKNKHLKEWMTSGLPNS